MRVVFLNALPLNALPGYAVLEVEKTTFKRVKWYMERASKVECYIRHPSTVKAVEEALGVKLDCSNGLYKRERGDVIVVVTLKRPVRGRDVEAKPEDLDVYIVHVFDEEELDWL